MAIFLLDTTVLIDAINRKRGRDRLLDGLLEQGNLLACCCINVTEVYAGMRPNELMATETLLRSLDFYQVTWDIARRAGELKVEWAKRGHAIAVPDVTITAVALEHSLTLVTDNWKHFPMPELKVLHLTDLTIEE
jgi:predicted nucleic acid-binding protein